jgi:phage-related protein
LVPFEGIELGDAQNINFDVIFYQTPNGREVVLDEIRILDKRDKITIGEDIKVAQMRFPKGAPVVKPMGQGLYEIRSTISGPREFRCLFFHSSKEKCLVIVHAFIKKTKATPALAIKLARTRITDFDHT